MAGGLGTVGTVFAAAAGFDVVQCAELDFCGVMEAAVDTCLRGVSEDAGQGREGTYCGESKVHQPRVIYLLDLGFGPGIPWLRGFDCILEDRRGAGGGGDYGAVCAREAAGGGEEGAGADHCCLFREV